jgi:hypothetical protein
MVGQRHRFVLSAGMGALALVLMGSMLFGSAFAQSTPTAENGATPEAGTGMAGQTTKQGAYQDFIGKLAANLGISDTGSVDTAIRTTLKQMVDEQQAAGRLTAAQANALKERIDAGDFPRDFAGMGAFGQHRMFGRGERGNRQGNQRGNKRIRGRTEVRQGALATDINQLATFFGESPANLRAELNQGMSLAQIATAHGKTRDELKTFLMNQIESRIDAMIDAGASNQPAPATGTPGASATPSI